MNNGQENGRNAQRSPTMTLFAIHPETAGALIVSEAPALALLRWLSKSWSGSLPWAFARLKTTPTMGRRRRRGPKMGPSSPEAAYQIVDSNAPAGMSVG
jgi:hypothetical protein